MIARLCSSAICALLLALPAGCGKPAPETAALLSDIHHQAAGVGWRVPQAWSVQPDRPMRVATYQVPSDEEGVEAAECAVFYFGTEQGGDVEMNIQRWAGQFESAPRPGRSAREVGGIQVTTVDIAGTYLSPGGPMMTAQARKENYRLLGMIVEAPDGSVFFKMTGPDAVVEAARPSMDALVSSLQVL